MVYFIDNIRSIGPFFKVLLQLNKENAFVLISFAILEN